MADVVQFRLERMVAELEDFERRDLFTRAEIAEIVKQRRKFEYRLKRPSPIKQDFLDYIEYETQLDSLRRLRKKLVTDESMKKRRKSISDFAGVVRIIGIYKLAVMRYKGDIGLWFRYLEFCRMRKNGRMKKILAQAIRFHPKVPGIWIYAAAWEFDTNLNVAAARALMQSGLRACPTSEDLWAEYLRMELTYLNKLKARKVALGEEKGSLVRDKKGTDEKQWRDENGELFMSLDEGKEKGKDSDDENEYSTDLFREQGSNILQAIYSGAVAALPSSFNLRKRFLEILDATDLARAEEMREKILTDMKKDFYKEPEFWDWFARLEMDDSIENQDTNEDNMIRRLQKATQVYNEAIETLPSSLMFERYIKFLMDVIAPKSGDSSQVPSSNTKDYISQLINVYEKAETEGFLTEDLTCDCVSFFLQLGLSDEAKKLAEKLLGDRFSDSAKLWVLRASIEAKCLSKKFGAPSKAELQTMFDILRNGFIKVPTSEAETLWLMALKFFATKKSYFNKLVEISYTSLAKDGGSDKGFSLSSAIVNFVLQKDGIQQAREMYKRFLGLPRPGLALYRDCIEIEMAIASLGDKDSLTNARRLYETALSTYDQNSSLWSDYHSMETKLGTSETAASIYWRARKTLKDSGSFVALEVSM